MNPIFNLGNIYFDVISLAIIVILLISLFLGISRGFMFEALSFTKIVIVLGVSILLCVPLGKLLMSTGIGTSLKGSVSNWLYSVDSTLFDEIVTEDNKQQLIAQCLNSINIPSAFQNSVSSFLDKSIVVNETFGASFSTIFTTLILTAISFLVLLILTSILVAILKKLTKNINKVPVLGPINRILGGVFAVAKVYLILDTTLLLVTMAVLPKSDLGISQWIIKTLLLDADEMNSLAKFMINNSLTKFILNFISTKI